MIARLWNLLCSLKLAIVLATAAVLALLAGSLRMPARPEIFGPMDQMALGEWLDRAWSHAPAEAFWVSAAGLLAFLLGVNTLCCFLDWIVNFRIRWRKSGEYLLHLGFVLALAGYLWGSAAGFRNEGVRLRAGETAPVAGWGGHYLRLESIEPILGPMGAPAGLAGTMALLRGDEEIARHRVRTNSPLTHGGLAVIPLTVVPEVAGLRVFTSGVGFLDLVPGARYSVPSGADLKVLAFHPWGVRLPDGSVARRGEDLVQPAVELELAAPGETPWRGWYFPNEGVPVSLRRAGIHLQPTETIPTWSGVFAVNSDPGAPLALAGGICMTAGILLALFSFYSKRARGDRPEIF